MFLGLALQTLSSTLKGRILYLFLITLTVWTGALYVISHATVQISATPNIPLNGASAFTGIPSLGSVLTFLSIFAASRRIPEMLRPTLAGFYLSKPVSRPRLLSYTMLSTTIVFSLIIALSLSIYGAFLREFFPAHVSLLEIVEQISLEVFVFIVYVPILSFFGLTTRSGSFAFLLTFGVWLVAKVLALEEMRGFLLLIDNSFFTHLADIIFYMLPRSSDISSLVATVKTVGAEAADWSALWTSMLSAIGFYALSVLRFRRMDF